MNSPNISNEYILEKRKEIGTRLKAIREGRGLTMEQAGELLNVGKSTISKVEAGKWNFGIDTLTSFAVVYEFDIDLFLK